MLENVETDAKDRPIPSVNYRKACHFAVNRDDRSATLSSSLQIDSLLLISTRGKY